MLALIFLLPRAVFSQDRTELVGRIGSRPALLILHSAQREDGGWQVTGEYLLLPTLVHRFLEGERSPGLGVTTLNGPGGQARERFEFSGEFPPLDAYSASVRCQADGARYSSTLGYAIESGKLKSFDWRSRLTAGGHSCTLTGVEQQPFNGGLRFVAGRCAVTLREVGDQVKVDAEGCTQYCGSEAYFEPLLVDRRGNCRLLRPEAR